MREKTIYSPRIISNMMSSRSKTIGNNNLNNVGTYSSCYHQDHEKDYSSSETNLETKFISK